MKMNYSEFYKSFTNIYGKASASIPLGFALPPIRITLELTYKCNLRCRMCYQRDERKRRRGRELTEGEIKKIINQMLPKTLITLTGGEPLVRKDALKIIEYTCRRHYCNIITNGALIDEKVARRLVSANLTLAGVSIDGLDKTHDKIRCVKGAFKKAITGIELIQKEKQRQEKKFPLIDIKTVILPENSGQLYQIYKLAQELKVDYLTLSVLRGDASLILPPILKTVFPSDYGTLPKVNEVFDINLLEEQLKKILSKKSSVQLRFYPKGLDQGLKNYYHHKITPQSYFPCYFPWITFFVSPYGDVFPCLTLSMGNIKKHSLYKIWNGKKFRHFRLKLKKAKVFPVCQGCCNLLLK
jgi:MoaA/NifB/PqqE/SkfB family radical SAM enzyme